MRETLAVVAVLVAAVLVVLLVPQIPPTDAGTPPEMTGEFKETWRGTASMLYKVVGEPAIVTQKHNDVARFMTDDGLQKFDLILTLENPVGNDRRGTLTVYPLYGRTGDRYTGDQYDVVVSAYPGSLVVLRKDSAFQYPGMSELEIDMYFFESGDKLTGAGSITARLDAEVPFLALLFSSDIELARD